jgi:small subunit ribosomal protein S3
MVVEHKFIEEKVNRMQIKEFLRKRIAGAGFGGVDIQRTPMGTRISLIVERPGLVIGRGGANIAKLTEEIKENFGVDNPQIEIVEAGERATLNAQIMAEKLAEALERGWHFRRAGHSIVRRIMEAGAKGCQVIIAGKLIGARHRTEKFTEGHIKYCGESARDVMEEGYATAKKKPGMIGVKVRIMKPEAKLPDEVVLKLPEEEKRLAEIVEDAALKELERKGIKTVEDLQELSIDELASIKGLDKKTAKEIKEQLKKLSEEVS